jgi:Uncharacterised nucleotidyltransferase
MRAMSAIPPTPRETSAPSSSRGHRPPDADVALPPLATIAAALSKTTEFLARELADPAREPPAWTEFEWRIARVTVAIQGIAGVLIDKLRWKGPESWQQFLTEQRSHVAGRHLRIVRLIEALDAQARRCGLALMALKGAALYARGLYAAGERPMGDIDLLVRPDAAAATARLLESCGYQLEYTHRRDQAFRPAGSTLPPAGSLGEHVDYPIMIEVHTRIAERLPAIETDITSLLFPANAQAGLNYYPSPAALMMHLALHAAGNMRARALRLIQLHDIALLAAHFAEDDWEELLAAHSDGEGPWWAFAPMRLTARYYPTAIPPRVLARLGTHCPSLLKRHTQRRGLVGVSWSNVYVEAFPGVEWSRTPGEALRFMKSRFWPSRDALRELKEGAAQIPGVSTIPWYGESHAKRILRWVLSRPPRVQTLLSVRAALSQSH